MSKTNGEGRSSSEKAGRLIVPSAVRRAQREKARREEEEWARRNGPVEVRRVEQ